MTLWPRARATADWRVREEAVRVVFDGALGVKYEFRNLLGYGGMGSVALARHRKLDNLVAIKLLHAELCNTEFLSRFHREARSAVKIRSEHVVHVHDIGELSDGIPYIVMEYLEGTDLAERLAVRGKMSARRAVRLMLQALDALSEAHALGIVHRDLKPANLFVSKDRQGRDFLKVLDFGLAKVDPGNDSSHPIATEPGTLVGSPCYMPPEQLFDASNTDARSDVWALGATLFELLAGQPPFRASSMPQLCMAVFQGQIRRVKDCVVDLPSWLDDVVAKCLARRREDRYANAGTLRAALLDGMSEGPLDGHGTRETGTRSIGSRRRRATQKRQELANEIDSTIYRTLLESTKAIPWKIDWATMRFTYMGPQIEALLGWPPASWVTAQDWADRIHPDDRQRVVGFCTAQSKAGIDHEADYRAATKNGDYVWLRDVVHVFRSDDGAVQALMGFMFDIRDRRKTEEELLIRSSSPLQMNEATKTRTASFTSLWTMPEQDVASAVRSKKS